MYVAKNPPPAELVQPPWWAHDAYLVRLQCETLQRARALAEKCGEFRQWLPPEMRAALEGYETAHDTYQRELLARRPA